MKVGDYIIISNISPGSFGATQLLAIVTAANNTATNYRRIDYWHPKLGRAYIGGSISSWKHCRLATSAEVLEAKLLGVCP